MALTPRKTKPRTQAVNPNRKPDEDTRTPAELIALIREKGREVEQALAQLEASHPLPGE